MKGVNYGNPPPSHLDGEPLAIPKEKATWVEP